LLNIKQKKHQYICWKRRDMNQEIRNKLRNVVTQCRKLLEDSVSQELEGKYGIFARRDKVTADPNAAMAHLSKEEQAARKDILDHFGHIQARGFKPKDALDQFGAGNRLHSPEPAMRLQDDGGP
jgi:hypothetical protein